MQRLRRLFPPRAGSRRNIDCETVRNYCQQFRFERKPGSLQFRRYVDTRLLKPRPNEPISLRVDPKLEPLVAIPLHSMDWKRVEQLIRKDQSRNLLLF